MIKTYDNVLNKSLITSVMGYFKSMLSLDVWSSSIGWDQNLSLISTNTLTHVINDKLLIKQIKESIEKAIDVNFEKENLIFTTSIYVWSGGSYITWHNDACYEGFYLHHGNRHFGSVWMDHKKASFVRDQDRVHCLEY